MCILLKLHYARFDVSTYIVFFKSYRRKTLGGPRKRLSVKNNRVSMNENRKSDFQIQTIRSFDYSDPIKLATFSVFIYSKMEHKINKIRRNLYTSGELRICQLTRCVYFLNTTITSEIISQ